MSLRKGFRPAADDRSRVRRRSVFVVRRVRSGQSDQGRRRPVADRRRRLARQAAPDGARALARRRQRQGRDARPAGRSCFYYDDQSSPSQRAGIYTKLITVDKVDLLLGPYATNMVAPAMPVIMQNNKMTISLRRSASTGTSTIRRYFSMVPVGPKGPGAFSTGSSSWRRQQNAEAADCGDRGGRRGVRPDRARRAPATTPRQPASRSSTTVRIRRPRPTSLPVVRAVQAANPDIVYVAAYPPDTVGIIRAANEINLAPKMFGGAMIGMLVTPIKVQLGPLANGLVIGETFRASADRSNSPAVADLFKRYQAKAAAQRTDPLGHGFVPFGYAAGQSARAGGRGDQEHRTTRSSRELHPHNTFKTVVGRRRVRQGRRMDEIAPALHPVPERRAQRPRAVPRRHEAGDPVAARIQDRQHDLSVRRREEEVGLI